jgi:hypothetical protein
MANYLRHVQTYDGHEFQNGPIGCQNIIATQSTSLSDVDSSRTRPDFPKGPSMDAPLWIIFRDQVPP